MEEDNTEFEFKIPFLIANVAKRESGKSFLTKYLVHYWISNNEFDEVMAFTNTNKLNGEYNYLKKKYILDRYNESTMTKIMKAQEKQIISKGKEKAKNILIIMDDIIGSLDSQSTIIRELITQGRHYKISLILNIQISKKEFSPDFRTNVDYFIIGYNGKETFTQLYKELSFNGKFKDFMEFMHKNTVGFNFVLYINKVMETYEIKNRYKIIKASDSEELKNFHIK